MKKGILSKILVILLVFTMLFCITSCDGVSNYRATTMVKTVKDNYCEVSFGSLKGRIVMNPRFTKSAEGALTCTASLEEGEMDIYYESCGVKTHLMNVKAGEEKTLTGGYIERGRVKVYVETEGAKGGNVEINLGTP